jgi:hypothetical protein
MPFLRINPRYELMVHQNHLHAPEDFFELPRAVVCGHADRHVARTYLVRDRQRIPAFLKVEHRVPWKERVLNWFAGFGWVSKSVREGETLRSLERSAIGHPEWIAMGHDGGRAFLLVKEVEDAIDMRLFLRDVANSAERRRFFERLGAALACIHNAGFDHPDLFPKHILVNCKDGAITLLDWQRSRRYRRLPHRQRWEALARLNLTLTDDVATPGERLTCLQAYLRHSLALNTDGSQLHHEAATAILAVQRRLTGRHRLERLRRLPLNAKEQTLIWQDGEALCLTPEFKESLGSAVPDWLVLDNLPKSRRQFLTTRHLCTPWSSQARLVQRRELRLFRGIWCWLSQHRPESAETRCASLIFRLDRAGVPAPKLLAFGQCHGPPWRIDSFLLTESSPRTISLRRWLLEHAHATLAQKRLALREAAVLIKRLHDANCYFIDLEHAAGRRLGLTAIDAIHVQAVGSSIRLILNNVDSLFASRRSKRRLSTRDLLVLRESVAWALSSTDQMRFLLAYFQERHATTEIKRFIASLPNWLIRAESVPQPHGAPSLSSVQAISA